MKRIVAGIMALTISVCAFTSCGSKSSGSGSSSKPYEKAITDMVDAVNKGDVEAVMGAAMPSEVFDKYKELIGDQWDDYKDQMKEELGEEKVSVEIKEAKKMDDDELKDATENFNSMASMVGVEKEYTIKEGYSVDCTIKTGDDSEDETIPVYNIDDKWYVDFDM